MRVCSAVGQREDYLVVLVLTRVDCILCKVRTNLTVGEERGTDIEVEPIHFCLNKKLWYGQIFL